MVAIKITSQLVALAVLASSTAASALKVNAPWSNYDSNVVSFGIPSEIEADSLHNIHVTITDKSFNGDLNIVYGDCDSATSDSHHHSVASTKVERDAHPERFVWVVPQDLPNGCLHAYSGDKLIGRSAPVKRSLKKRQNIAEVSDELGRWFDGVAYMKGKKNTGVYIKQAKQKKIAIVGGGMAGLFTSHLLDSVGMKNWHIHESSQRVGGRIRTKYLAGSKPEDYQYQEMGPMRFPFTIEYKNGESIEIKDHHMVKQLTESLNKLNKGKNKALEVKWIPWIQSSPNVPANTRGGRLPDGRIPSASDVAANPSLRLPGPEPANATEAEYARKMWGEHVVINATVLKEVAEDMYGAHKKAVENGSLDWSETAYLHYKLGVSMDTSDFIGGSMSGGAIWGDFYDSGYFAATQWKTIDKGLESIPKAFVPHIKNKITYGRKITGLKYNDKTKKIALNWREKGREFDMKPSSEEYDFAVVAAPFTKVRLWDLPKYSSLLSRAINTMNYSPSCKISLHYKTRFWEHLPKPILGGCGSVDIPGIGSVCYPAYKINSTGPGVILASYSSGTSARSLGALSEKDHVALAQRAMVEAHGPIAEKQFTGNYDRQCWEHDEHIAGAWASPLVGQQELFLPSYYNTEFNTIFIGEHTSYTHAWIFSALDSAVRGTTQLLLDLGLVDEAKEIVHTWMGRWIKI